MTWDFERAAAEHRLGGPHHHRQKVCTHEMRWGAASTRVLPSGKQLCTAAANKAQ